MTASGLSDWSQHPRSNITAEGRNNVQVNRSRFKLLYPFQNTCKIPFPKPLSTVKHSLMDVAALEADVLANDVCEGVVEAPAAADADDERLYFFVVGNEKAGAEKARAIVPGEEMMRGEGEAVHGAFLVRVEAKEVDNSATVTKIVHDQRAVRGLGVGQEVAKDFERERG